MSVEITVLISISTALIGVAFSYLALKRTAHKDMQETGKNDGVMIAQLGSLQAGINDIKSELKDQAKTNMDVITRLVAVEASVKQSHRRMDDFLEHNNGGK